ncbi:hypothetical protein [Rhodococcus sp. ACT016]|uniref:hypothetical protein n=1 Tax=Rhodococcus sp. ACT016 TaxID=3134808 RepID=UPI003D275782
MSQSLQAALPSGVEVAFASPSQSLFFQPIMGGGPSQEDGSDFDGDTNATATVLRDGKRGSLWVSIRQSTDPIPPCVAGYLDARRMLADGTVVDVVDTWSETNGVRTLSRSAHAYVPDGTRVSANSTDATFSGSTETNSGTVPLTVDELASVVAAPGLRVSTPVPPGTDAPPESCYSPVEEGSGPAIDHATAERLDVVLASLPLDGITLDRRLGALWPASSDNGAVCQTARVTTPGQEATLDIAIAGGQELPSTQAPPETGGTGDRTTVRQSPDGTVVEHSENSFASIGVRAGSEPKFTTRRAVTVTHPSGTLVRVISSADSPAAPLSFEQLDAVALAPGLEVAP